MRTIGIGHLKFAPGITFLGLLVFLAPGGCGNSAMSGKQTPDGSGVGADAPAGAGGALATGAGGRGMGGSVGVGGAAGGAGGAGNDGGTGARDGSPVGGALGSGGAPGSGGAGGVGGAPGSGGTTGGGATLGTGGANAAGGSRGAGGMTGGGGTTAVDAAAEAAACEVDCAVADTAARDVNQRDRAFDIGAVEDGPAVGGACGATSDLPCADGAYCEWSDNLCGARSEGACAAIPRAVLCVISAVPVCGCDGQNYPGACEAAKAGVDVSSNADCPAPAGMFRCGWSYCQHGAEYCSAQIGGAVTNPGSYTCAALPAACNGVPSCACVTASTFCATNAGGDVTVTLPVP